MKIKKHIKNKTIIANRRILSITLILGLIVSLIIANVVYIMVSGVHFRSGKSILEEKKDSGLYKQQIIASRGAIYDRNGEIIAQDIEAYNLIAVIDENRKGADGSIAYVEDYDVTSAKISEVTGVEQSIILGYLNDAQANDLYQTEFGSYGKELTAQQKEDLVNSGLTGLEFESTIDRVYPISHFASQLVGYAQYSEDDEKISGVMGMEKLFDEELSGSDGEITYQTDSAGNYIPNTSKYTAIAENGNNIYLTLDQNVQVTVEAALAKTMESNNAEKAWCVVMEAETGKILAQAGYPSFDLNEREVIEEFNNLPSQHVFEPGSVMKPFVYAAAMEEGVYPNDASFQSGSISVAVDGNGEVYEVAEGSGIVTINDAMGKDYGTIGYDEGFIRSTNTAIIEILLNFLDPSLNIEYMKNFKLFDRVDMYGVEENTGQLNATNEIDQLMLGFGQGTSLNSYQLIQGASAFFTDGRVTTPYVVEKIVDPNTNEVVFQAEQEKSDQLLSDPTLNQIQALLKRVVSEDYGTANNYEMSDISLMAKTGTGEIYDAENGGYQKDIYTTSILAAAPSENPEVIIYYGFQSNNIQYYDTEYFQDIVRESLLAVDSYSTNNSQTTSNTQSAVFNVYAMPNLVNHSFDYINKKLEGNANQVIYIGDGTSVIEQYPSPNAESVSTQKVFLLTDSINHIMPDMSGWSRKDVTVYCEMIGIDVTFGGSGYVASQDIAVGKLIEESSVLHIELT